MDTGSRRSRKLPGRSLDPDIRRRQVRSNTLGIASFPYGMPALAAPGRIFRAVGTGRIRCRIKVYARVFVHLRRKQRLTRPDTEQLERETHMSDATLGPDPTAETLGMLWSPLLAITTHYQGRDNGMVAATGVFASLVPEAPRVLIELTKTSLTHDLVLASRVLALHTLPATPPDALATSVSLVHTLGMRSGHDGDKMAGIATHQGVTRSPILAETLTYVEARVVATLDAEELTIFLADVVDGGRHRSGEPLTLRVLRERLPKEWLAGWAVCRERQIDEARRRRGLR